MSTTHLKALTKQREPQHNSEGQWSDLQATRLGQLFTADWKMRLLLSGRCFEVTLGDATGGGGGAPSGVTGGGAGTTIDSDQPELIVGVLAGTYLVPLECRCALSADLDADAEIAEITLFADVTQAPPATATATAETPSPCLDTGIASVARAWSAVTADITDPVASVLLDHEIVREAEVTAASIHNVRCKMHYEPALPKIFAGPCSLVLCYGGTAAVTGMATVTWAEIPATWIEGS